MDKGIFYTCTVFLRWRKKGSSSRAWALGFGCWRMFQIRERKEEREGERKRGCACGGGVVGGEMEVEMEMEMEG